MKEELVVKLLADASPAGIAAFEKWLEFQYIEMYTMTVVCLLVACVFGYLLYLVGK